MGIDWGVVVTQLINAVVNNVVPILVTAVITPLMVAAVGFITEKTGVNKNALIQNAAYQGVLFAENYMKGTSGVEKLTVASDFMVKSLAAIKITVDPVVVRGSIEAILAGTINAAKNGLAPKNV